MRRAITAICLLSIAGSTAAAQATPATPPAKMTQAEANLASLTRLEELWGLMHVRRDRAGFGRTLGPNFVYTRDDQLLHRAEYMSAVLEGSEIITDARPDSIEVNVTGNTGVVTGVRIVSGRGRDGGFERRIRFTDIWMPRNGTWQMIAAHDYVVPVIK